MKNEIIAKDDSNRVVTPADPSDPEDFDVTTAALQRGLNARMIRTTRTGLGLTQQEFADRFHVPLGTLRHWEQARVDAPDYAIAYVKAIRAAPEIVAKAVA